MQSVIFFCFAFNRLAHVRPALFCLEAAKHYGEGALSACCGFQSRRPLSAGAQTHLPARVTIEGRYSVVAAYCRIAEMSIGQLCWLGP